DGRGGFSTATVTLNVAAENDAPVAAADSYGGTEDTPLVVDASSGVLSNDTDADGDGLTVDSFDAASANGGTVSMNADGSFTYTPQTGFSGADTFSLHRHRRCPHRYSNGECFNWNDAAGNEFRYHRVWNGRK
ncbi:MAG: hypothetical protein ACI9MU_004006, partial [Alphaproteobacteria bacterium]